MMFTREENRRGRRNLFILTPGVMLALYVVYGMPLMYASGMEQPMSLTQLAVVVTAATLVYGALLIRVIKKT